MTEILRLPRCEMKRTFQKWKTSTSEKSKQRGGIGRLAGRPGGKDAQLDELVAALALAIKKAASKGPCLVNRAKIGFLVQKHARHVLAVQ